MCVQWTTERMAQKIEVSAVQKIDLLSSFAQIIILTFDHIN